MRLISAIATTVAVFFCSSVLRAESVYVKYRGDVHLRFFDCWEITRSSFIKRACYDRRNEYMLITLNGTLYHYCEIDAGTVSSLLSAPSIERFYNARIKGHLTAGFIEGLNIESSVEGPSPCRAGSRFDCEPGSAAGARPALIRIPRDRCRSSKELSSATRYAQRRRRCSKRSLSSASSVARVSSRPPNT